MTHKYLSVALCVVMLLSLLPLAGLADETPVFVLGVPDAVNVIDWETNEQTLKIEETLGIDLQFVKYPSDSAEYQQKLELAMLSGEKLPDALMLNFTLTPAQAQLYAEMGKIVPLTEYFAEKTPYLDANLASMTANGISKEDYVMYVTSPDGEAYGFGTATTTPNNSISDGRILVNEAWENAYLEAAGLEDVTTTEQFKDMLIYFRDNDMNGNGDPNDEIPLLANKDTVMTNLLCALMNPFIYTQENYYYNDNGAVAFAPVTDGWKEGLKYIKSLFDEGLISTLSLTQDGTQFNAICTAEPTTVGVMARISTSNLLSTDARRLEYVPVNALEGPSGLRQTFQKPNTPSIRYIVTSSCKDVDMAVKLADYLSSIEINIWSRYGIEGENWRRVNADEVNGRSLYESMGIKGDMEVFNPVWGSAQNVHWHQTGLCLSDGSSTSLRVIAAIEEGAYDHMVRIAENLPYEMSFINKEAGLFALIYTADEQAVVAEYQNTVNDYVAETFAQFITGAVDIDAGWDSYVKEFYKMGLEEYLGAVQSAWTRMNSK